MKSRSRNRNRKSATCLSWLVVSRVWWCLRWSVKRTWSLWSEQCSILKNPSYRSLYHRRAYSAVLFVFSICLAFRWVPQCASVPPNSRSPWLQSIRQLRMPYIGHVLRAYCLNVESPESQLIFFLFLSAALSFCAIQRESRAGRIDLWLEWLARVWSERPLSLAIQTNRICSPSFRINDNRTAQIFQAKINAENNNKERSDTVHINCLWYIDFQSGPRTKEKKKHKRYSEAVLYGL